MFYLYQPRTAYFSAHVHRRQPFISYPSYHVPAQNTDPAQAQQLQHSYPQAPLLPTSFIQGDQGTLIPVYHPEALDHYMSSGRTTSPPLSQPQHHSQSPSYPFHTAVSQAVLPIGLSSQHLPINQYQPQPSIGVTWNPGPPHGVLGSQQPQVAVPQASLNIQNRPPPSIIRGSYTGVGSGQQFDHLAPPPRRYHRREQQSTTAGNNSNRNNNNSRGGMSNNRFSRGGTNGTHQQDSGSHRHPPSMPTNLVHNVGSWA